MHSIFDIQVRRLVLPLILAAAALSLAGCEALATGTAREALESGRQIRDLEREHIQPIEDELEALYADEIQPLEWERDDIWAQINDIESQAYGGFRVDDPWGPGGEAFELQQQFHERYEAIEVEMRELDRRSRLAQIEHQDAFSGNSDEELLVLQDRRYELQRELDRLQRFGWQPIEDVYNEINRLSLSLHANPDDGRADQILAEIQALYDQAASLGNTGSADISSLEAQLQAANERLAELHGPGRADIEELTERIIDLESAAGTVSDSTTVVTNDGDPELIAELEAKRSVLIAEHEELINALELQRAEIVSTFESDAAPIQARINELSDAAGNVTSDNEAQIAELQQQLEARELQRDADVDELEALIVSLGAEIDAETERINGLIAERNASIDALEAERAGLDTETEEGAARDAEIGEEIGVLNSEIDALEADLGAYVDPRQEQRVAADLEIGDVIDAAAADIAALEADLADLQSAADSTEGDDAAAAELEDLLAQLHALEEQYSADLAAVDAEIDGARAGHEAALSEIDAELAGLSSTTTVTGGDGELAALRDQLAQMELEWLDQVEAVKNEIEFLTGAIANNRNNGQAEADSIYAKIDELNRELQSINDGTAGNTSDIDGRIYELNEKAMRMQEELQADIRSLETKIWEIDDQIALIWREQERRSVTANSEHQDLMREIELARLELEERRWALDEEQRDAFDKFNQVAVDGKAELETSVRAELEPLYTRIDEIEALLKEKQLQVRELEAKLREARQFVEERQREIEDQVFDLLDQAVTDAENQAGVVTTATAIATE